MLPADQRSQVSNDFSRYPRPLHSSQIQNSSGKQILLCNSDQIFPRKPFLLPVLLQKLVGDVFLFLGRGILRDILRDFFRPTKYKQQKNLNQAVLQGVAFRGVQVSRWKRLILLNEKKGPGNRKNEVKLHPPLCSPLKHSIRGRVNREVQTVN